MCFFFLFIFKIRPKYAKALTEVQPIREPIAYRPFAAPLAEIDPQFLLEEDYPSGSIQDLVKKEDQKLEEKLKPKTRGRGVAIMMRRWYSKLQNGKLLFLKHIHCIFILRQALRLLMLVTLT